MPKILKQHHQLVLIFCGVVTLTVLVACTTSNGLGNSVENGVLDLTQWNFAESGPVALNGEWAFAWKQLVLPKDSDSIDDNLYVPKYWGGTTRSGVKLTSEGYGTYVLTILLPESDDASFGFYLPIIGFASTIWINGKLSYQSGKVADNQESMIPNASKDVFFVDIDKPEIKLVMQVSNFVHHLGGIESRLLFGPRDQIMRLRIKNIFFEAFLTGSLVFTAILHLMIVLLFAKKRAAILFALTCLNVALFSLVNGEHVLAYLIPSLPWAIKIKIDFLTAFAFSVPLIAAFIYDLFPVPNTKNLLKIIFGISLLTAIFIISAPVNTFTQLLNFFEFLLIVQCIYIAYLLIVAINNGLQGSAILFSGGIVLLMAAISEILFYEQQISFGPLVLIGFWFFLLSQAFAFAIQFMTTYNKLKRFSVNLEWQVDERTRNLQQANQKLLQEIQKKEEIEEQLRTLSQTDPLTKIDNRYKFNETLDEEIRRVNRYEGGLSIIMFDIDHFKKVNDTHGHDVGDRILVNVAQLVENMIRDIDSFARWGGEEFVILTPNNDIDGATMLAERIRKTIELSDFTPVNTLTASFGVIEYTRNEEKTSFFKRVDGALYSAKYQGRNQVVRHEN